MAARIALSTVLLLLVLLPWFETRAITAQEKENVVKEWTKVFDTVDVELQYKVTEKDAFEGGKLYYLVFRLINRNNAEVKVATDVSWEEWQEGIQPDWVKRSWKTTKDFGNRSELKALETKEVERRYVGKKQPRNVDGTITPEGAKKEDDGLPVVTRELRKFEGAEGGAVFSPDGTHVLTRSYDSTANLQMWTVRLWDAATGKELHKFEHSGGGYGTDAVFSPDGTQVLTNRYKAFLWDAATGKELRKFEHGGGNGEVYSAVFSPDGKQVLTASRDMTARLWDAATGKELRHFEGHEHFVKSAVFSPDGKQVLTASDDWTARLWDAATGKELRRFEHPDYVISVVFSPDGKQVLTRSGRIRTARLWDVATGKELQRFEHDDYVSSVVFSPDGKHVLTAGKGKTARLWDAATGKELRKFEHGGGNREVKSAVFSPDGKHVLTAGVDKTARLWDAATSKELRRFEHPLWVSNAVFSPDGKQVLTTCGDEISRLWRVEN